MAVQPDGTILIGGAFDRYNGTFARYNFARLTTDGLLDHAVPTAGTSGAVNSIAIGTDGKIVLGGDFVQAGGLTRRGVARLAGTPLTVPSQPRSVTGVAGNRSVTVSWLPPESDGGAPVDGYQVTANPGNITHTVTEAASTFEQLDNGTAYTFTVKAHSYSGWGPESAATVVTPRTLPSEPRSVTAAPGDESAAVTWLAPLSDGGAPVDSYTVTSTPGDRTCTSDGLTCTVTGLTNGSSYQFRVKARNAAGEGPASQSSAWVTIRAVPRAPRSVTAAAHNRSATVSWFAPESDGGVPIDRYTVTAAPGGRTCISTGLACTVTRLENGTAYRFSVTAHNSLGEGPASTPSEVVTPQTELVGQPASLAFGNTRVDRQSDRRRSRWPTPLPAR